MAAATAGSSSNSSSSAAAPPSIAYHCPCQLTDPVLPYPYRPSAGLAFQPLDELFFCEECDAVRCNRCVATEVACYFCPHCLFEVPNASVRAELNRCARNCFNCPQCTHTLSVHASADPPAPATAAGESRSTTPPPALDEPFYYLACNFCRWSSAETGPTFEKPTGIALQLQKRDDASPAAQEFDRLRTHFETLVRPPTASGASGSLRASTAHVSSSIAAASSALRRTAGSRSKAAPRYSKGGRPTAAPDAGPGDGDELAPYDALGPARSEAGRTTPSWLGSDDAAAWLSQVDDLSGIAPLASRWASPWVQSVRARDLPPTRVHLQSRKTKRCRSCLHILIKPEQKAQSARFKIKLLAGAYLPAVEISRRMPGALLTSAGMRRDRSSRLSTIGARGGEGVAASLVAADKDGLTRGQSYSYHLAFTNPLFDVIQVELDVLHPVPAEGVLPPLLSALPSSTTAPAAASDSPAAAPSAESASQPYRPPFIVSLPVHAFPVGASVGGWEYGDDGADDIDALLENTAAGEPGAAAGRRKSAGGAGAGARKGGAFVERKGNCTKVGLGLQVGEDAVGDLSFTLRVAFTYRADDEGAERAASSTNAAAAEAGDAATDDGLKTFVFDTKVFLGRVEL